MVSAALKRRAPAPVEAVVIGGSAGAIAALGELLPELPADFPPVLVVVHVLASSVSPLAHVFARRCAVRVVEAEPGGPIERGSVYFAPADYHLLVESTRRCALSIEPPVHFSRPAIDVLFESAAYVYGAALAGVILTGASGDGALGLRAVSERQGRAIVQDPATAVARAMPDAAIAAVPAARVVTLSAMLAELRALEQA
jgi:two-component system, chemotaxis family, protein-glutamate methylesterase/glutaminase